VPDLLSEAPLTLLILGATTLISVAAFRDVRLLERLMIDVGAIRRRGEYDRLLTSGFIHGDPGHLIFNMLTLFFIGPYVEAATGSFAFAAAYAASLLGGSLLAFAENYRNPSYRALGASGAISGVTAMFALFAPFAILFVLFIPMPAIVFAAAYIAWSAYASGRMDDRIGHAAHLGGALTGVAVVCVFWPEAIGALADDMAALLS
jgi:membrane associated rhomboid family serine protease